MAIVNTTNPAGSYPVSDAACAQYRRDGHICLRSVCTPLELAPYRDAINNCVRRLNPERRALADRDTYGKAFHQTTNLWRHDETVKQFVFAKRFAQIAANLMGVDAVRLYHDQALYKEPGGGYTPWHQDQYYWPLDTAHTITMWMPLVDASPEMGVMSFASGSHERGFLGHIRISSESEEHFRQFVDEQGFAVSNPGAMRAGDATFHNGWTLHSAPGNSTDTMREVMTIIFFADGAKVIEPDNDNRVADLDAWLPGCKPGEAAASEINPRLFP